jgi:hypothetical protein
VTEVETDSADGKPLIRCAARKVDVLADEGETRSSAPMQTFSSAPTIYNSALSRSN